MEKYANTIMIITGASSGVGKSSTISILKEIDNTPFYQLPENVDKKPIIIGFSRRHVSDLEKIYKNFKSYQIDITDNEKLKEIFVEKIDKNEIFSKMGKEQKKISIVFNVAAKCRGVAVLNLNKPNSTLAVCEPDMSFENAAGAFKEMNDLNLLALTLICRLACERMDHEFPGYIINVCSMGGIRVPNKPVTHYDAATKFGVTAITECIRQELRIVGSKIRVGQISPGLINTELYDAMDVGNDLFYKRWDSMKNFMLLPEDVSDTFLFMVKCHPRCQYGEISLRAVMQEN